MGRVPAHDGGDRRAPHRSRSDQPEPGLVFGRAVEPHRLCGAAAVTGGATGATGIAAGCSSVRFAMNTPGTVYSWPPSSEKWICHRFSRPGDDKSTFITSGWPPLRVPLLMMATRGRTACIITSELEVFTP